MSSITCSKKPLLMNYLRVQNILLFQDHHAIIPINDLIYDDGGDSAQ